MDYFNNVTETIEYDPPDRAYVDINDPILRAIEKYRSYMNIHRIKLLSEGLAKLANIASQTSLFSSK